jgi:hypothetical protein
MASVWEDYVRLSMHPFEVLHHMDLSVREPEFPSAASRIFDVYMYLECIS